MTTIGLDVPAHRDELPQSFYRRVASAAETSGFQNLWVGDHLLWHQPRFETFALLGMLSGITSLTIGTGIALAPLRQPWWTAKSAASLQGMAPGGFVLGLGAGGEYAPEFELAGVELADRAARVDETIEFCRKAWSGELGPDFSPLPVRTVPIWVGGRKGKALTRAAHLADGWLGLFLDPIEFAAVRTLLSHETARAGRPPIKTSMAVWICTDSDGAEAKRRAVEVIAQEYRMPAARFARHVVAGTPDEVADRLAEYAEAGADHLDLHIAHPDPLSQIEVVGRTVTARLNS
jgi:alkanesulfonate monooxygenase SsuD/methylene tetrahydromethanopterin reductase-like flavin-dependent oxidoreductase (luciferase family)